MTSKFLKDLRCPQYVDFLGGMDSNSDSPFFDCSEYQTPQNRNPEKSSPVPEKGLTEDDENKLMNKMTAALSFIESTPKLKKNVLKEKLFTEKARLNPIKPPEIRPLPKSAAVKLLPTRIRSKTVARLDKIITGKANKVRDLKPKRSSSLTDLRTIKKHTLPKTPLCLKRTIDARAKAKALKTSEEMELEQITEFQKQLSKMLKQNEIAYRKLNSKQRPIPTKNPEAKPETLKGNTDMNADKYTRRGFKSMGHTAFQKVLKLDSIINGNSSKEASSKAFTASTSNSIIDLERSKLPSVSSSIISEEGEKSLPLFPKKSRPIPPKNPESKPDTFKGNTDMNADKNLRRGFKSMGHTAFKNVLNIDSIINGNSSKEALSKAFTASNSSTIDLEKSKIASSSSEEGEKTLPLFPKKSANIGFHSGIFFCDSNKKSTVPKPFTFEDRMKQKKTRSTANDENSEIISSNSVLSQDMNSSKENFSVMKSKSEIKMQNVMNLKPLTLKKTVGGSNRNTVRGFPLSENRNRN